MVKVGENNIVPEELFKLLITGIIFRINLEIGRFRVIIIEEGLSKHVSDVVASEVVGSVLIIDQNDSIIVLSDQNISLKKIIVAEHRFIGGQYPHNEVSIILGRCSLDHVDLLLFIVGVNLLSAFLIKCREKFGVFEILLEQRSLIHTLDVHFVEVGERNSQSSSIFLLIILLILNRSSIEIFLQSILIVSAVTFGTKTTL